jgi:hypothetical protein
VLLLLLLSLLLAHRRALLAGALCERRNRLKRRNGGYCGKRNAKA